MEHNVSGTVAVPTLRSLRPGTSERTEMRFATLNQISLSDLKAMADGTLEDTITDMDFLETLAAKKCFLLTPWVVCAGPTGQLSRVTKLLYTIDGKIDKPRVLVLVAQTLRRAAARKGLADFGPRFST